MLQDSLQRPIKINGLDLCMGDHHIINRDLFQIEQIKEDGAVLLRDVIPASSTMLRSSSVVTPCEVWAKLMLTPRMRTGRLRTD